MSDKLSNEMIFDINSISSLDQTAMFQDDPARERAPSYLRPTTSSDGSADSVLVVARVLDVEKGVAKLLYSIEDHHYLQEAVVTVGHPLSETDVDVDVCIAFANNDFLQPIVIGKLHRSSQQIGDIKLESDTQITLRCGKASISLKADGTVAIRGTNVASRASHTNRIRGGNVQNN